MSKMRYINTKFWDDPFVVDRLNPLDRYLYLYLMLNNKTSIAGIYEISLKTMANETGIEKDECLRMLRRLEPKVRYINGWIIVANTIKNQNYNSPKIKSGIELILQTCPDILLQYIVWPNDWTIPPNILKRMTLQGSLLPDGYGMDTVSHSNSNSNSNSKVPNGTVFLKDEKAAEPVVDLKLGKGYKIFQEKKKEIQKKKGLSK